MDNYTVSSTVNLTDLSGYAFTDVIPLVGGGFLFFGAPLGVANRDLKAFKYDNAATLDNSYTIATGNASYEICQLTTNSVIYSWEYDAASNLIYLERRSAGGTIEISATSIYTEGIDADNWNTIKLEPLTNGKFVLLTKYTQVGDGVGNYSLGFQVFNTNLTGYTSFVVVVDYGTDGVVFDAQIAALGDDKILITYTLNADTDERVYYKIYNYSGVLQSSGDIVNRATAYSYNAANKSTFRRTYGSAVVIWVIYENASSPHNVIYARKVNADGILDGMDWKLSNGTTPSTSPLQSNRFVVSFSDTDSSFEYHVGHLFDENANLNQVEDPMPSLTQSRHVTPFELSNKNLCFYYHYQTDYDHHRAQIWTSTPETYVQIAGITYTISTSNILGGVTVHCYRDSNGSLVDTQISDGNGAYTFTFLQEPGETYTLVGDKSGHVVGAADNITPTVI